MLVPRTTLCGVSVAHFVIGVLLALTWCPVPASADTPWVWNPPVGFPTPKVPPDNPMTVEKVALGRFLFYDKRMSGNQTQACASCHQQNLAFTDGLAQAVGSTGEVLPRGSLSLTNVAYASVLTWANPLLATLEQQVLVPMFNEMPVELGLTGHEDELFARLADDARYRRLFAEAFPDQTDPISLNSIVQSVTSFVRTLISGNAPYDRFVNGLDGFALSASAQNGAQLFFQQQTDCFHCHGGFDFQASVTFQGKVFDEVQFDNNALYNIGGTGAYPPDNTGLFAFTQVPSDMGRFRAPTLRNIALTAPYMHDGSIPTLQGVMDHYAVGGRTITSGPYAGEGSTSPFKSPFVHGFALSAEQIQDVINFLDSLTDEDFITNPKFSDPFAPPHCPADCNYDQRVTIDEIIAGVRIALDTTSLAACVGADVNGDGAVTIDELLAAVHAALTGCPPQPAPKLPSLR